MYQLTKVRDRKYTLEENHIFLFVSRGLSYLRFGPSVFPFTLIKFYKNIGEPSVDWGESLSNFSKMASLRQNLVHKIILLRTASTPRTLLLRGQSSAISFLFARKLASKAQITVHKEEKSEEEMKQSQTARAKVSEYLEKNGVRVQRVRRQIDLRKLTVEKISRVFKILDDIGIDHNQRHRIISNRPTILTTKDDLLRHRVKIMRIVGIFPESVAYVVKESPGVLTARIEESLPDKVGLTKRLIRTHSNFLKCNWCISCIIFHQSFYTVVV